MLLLATCISEHFVFCIITHMGDSILKKLPERLCVQYYNMVSFPVCLASNPIWPNTYVLR